ncbi:LLM class flavin-dependent oxidoreductase [Nonomuraea spiralis]|uniref:LLM class flavin-dependent oxidoreductase n=1 Tax=Nonomuraea spiralis TaxID=46182 RepID=A0ABV5I5A0_9ACTN|nr:LLM class flavin-dependent oxidoreductase [Nonomuraea spiralis]
MTLYSILDRSLLCQGSDAATSLRDTVALARQAEEPGYHRVRVAEHHSVPGAAGAAPARADRRHNQDAADLAHTVIARSAGARLEWRDADQTNLPTPPREGRP